MRIDNPLSEQTVDSKKIPGLDFRHVISVFDGQVEHGVRKGKGTLIFKYLDNAHRTIIDHNTFLTQQKYTGQFADNLPNGYGTMIYENGTKFVGHFKDGNRQGLGMEVVTVAEPGQEMVNKGIFEGNFRIGPNWAKVEGLRQAGNRLEETVL